MDRFGLNAKRIERVVVEIGGDEILVPDRRETPWPVIEALPGDIDIVAVEHAVDETRRQIRCREGRRCRAGEDEKPMGVRGIVVSRLFAVEVGQRVAGQRCDCGTIVEEGEALETAIRM